MPPCDIMSRSVVGLFLVNYGFVFLDLYWLCCLSFKDYLSFWCLQFIILMNFCFGSNRYINTHQLPSLTEDVAFQFIGEGVCH